MIGQEMASVAWFILESAGQEVNPYYWKVPESFLVPAIYFDIPEINTGGETFLTYHNQYVWHIRFVEHSEQGAWQRAFDVIQKIRAARNLVELRDQEGNKIEGEGVRIDDPKLIALDDNSAQITLSWRSRVPYSDTLIDRTKANVFDWFINLKDSHRPDDDEVNRILAEVENETKKSE